MSSLNLRFLALSKRCYRILKQAYHDRFVVEFGQELDQTFEQLYREEVQRAGYWGLVRFWIHILRDTAASALHSRIARDGYMAPDYVRLSMNEVQSRVLHLQKKRGGAALGAYGIELILVLVSTWTFMVTPNLLKVLGVALTIVAVSYQNWKRWRTNKRRSALDMARSVTIDEYRML